jgi:hypothetical protein
VTVNLSKTLMVLLVCLTFVGQTMASTVMSYHMISMQVMSSQKQSQNMPMMDHSKHNMMVESVDNEDSTSEDCCAKSCNCFAGGCSNFVTIMKTPDNNLIIGLSSKIPSYTRVAQNQTPTSLYRPPILS